MDQARDLADKLADNTVALMRGHGFVAAARSVIDVVRVSVYLPRNARALTTALTLGGEIKSLSRGEIDARNQKAYSPDSPATLARLGILGDQVRLRPHGDQARRGCGRQGVK